MREIKYLVLLLLLLSASIPSGAQQEALLIMKGKALSDAGRPDEAITILSDRMLLGSGFRAKLELGRAYLASGQNDLALRSFSEAEELAPGSASIYLARYHAASGETEKALQWLEKNIKSGFQRSEKEIMTDPEFSLLARTPAWREFWKRTHYDETSMALTQAKYLTDLGRFDEAGDLAEKVGETAAKKYIKALILFKQGNYRGALSEIGNDFSSGEDQWSARILKADCETALGNHVAAAATYSKMIDNGYTDPSILILRSRSYRKSGETDKALKDLEYFIDLYPGNKIANSEAAGLYNAKGDYYRSLNLLSENIRNFPGEASGYIERADIYLKSSSYTNAYADLSMSLDLDPGNAVAWLNMGISLVKMNRPEESCHFFRKAADLGSKQATGYTEKYCGK